MVKVTEFGMTDKQIEREEAFCEDWYMTRKMEKTPTFADAIAWADKTMIDKACGYLYAKTKMSGAEISKFRKVMEE